MSSVSMGTAGCCARVVARKNETQSARQAASMLICRFLIRDIFQSSVGVKIPRTRHPNPRGIRRECDGVYPVFEEEHVMLRMPALTAIVLLSVLPMTAAAQTASKQKSLYDRLGGKTAIAAVVDEFVGRVAAD